MNFGCVSVVNLMNTFLRNQREKVWAARIQECVQFILHMLRCQGNSIHMFTLKEVGKVWKSAKMRKSNMTCHVFFGLWCRGSVQKMNNFHNSQANSGGKALRIFLLLNPKQVVWRIYYLIYKIRYPNTLGNIKGKTIACRSSLYKVLSNYKILPRRKHLIQPQN